MTNKKKLLLAVACMALAVCSLVTGTLAWLTAKTTPVVNTFAPSSITLSLTGTIAEWKMIPGETYTYTPVVAVTSDIDCYLFVKFEELNSASTYLTYTSVLNDSNGWNQGDGTNIPSNVWYRVVGKDDETKSWNLLVGDTIVVKGNTVNAGNIATAANAKLQYTAYAIQQLGFATPEAAWAEAQTFGNT